MGYLQNLWNALDLSLLGDLLMRVAAVLLCLVVHETCHGLAAYAMGDPTAKRMHRLSLNPLHHIDWFGLAAMLVAGFGWAKPVPVDMRYFKNPKKGMALSALAGPVSNFILTVVLLFAMRFLEVFVPATAVTLWIYEFFLTVALLSVGLGLFNLLPIPPLDGSKVLFALLPDSSYMKLMRYERYGMILLMLLVFTGVGGDGLSRVIETVFLFLYQLIVI